VLVNFFVANIGFARNTSRYVCKVSKRNNEMVLMVALGLIAVALSIGLAAYGRHALADSVLQMRWSIGVEYLRDMGLGLLVMALLRNAWISEESKPWPERILVMGIALFSGVLFLESIVPIWIEEGPLSLAPPVGGISMIISWLWILVQFLTKKRPVPPKK
jgi:uncharacterized membrane protein YgdD (TMEM256/DUF423 family)|tara:strand:+ start:1679 stop:2161 length:483 start_codon:yes stop_codon:yes gene_type:complete